MARGSNSLARHAFSHSCAYPTIPLDQVCEKFSGKIVEESAAHPYDCVVAGDGPTPPSPFVAQETAEPDRHQQPLDRNHRPPFCAIDPPSRNRNSPGLLNSDEKRCAVRIVEAFGG